MTYLDFHLGQPVYQVQNESIKVTTTVQNACVLPYFKISEEKEICPYWIAPWWNDRLYDDGSTISSTLRGNFFCMERKGVTEYEHGRCANSPWEMVDVAEEDGRRQMRLAFYDPDGGTIYKDLQIRDGDSTVYETETLEGFAGEFSFNTHPCLKVPQKEKSGSLAGNWGSMQTATGELLDTENGTYSRLPGLTTYEDWTNVTTVYGETTDLSRHPQKKGTIDLLLAQTDAERNLGYAIFANPEEGYLYYQIKDATKLPFTMFWLFNGGRHFAPWNGTVDGCLGVEEMSGRICIFDADFPENPERHMIQFHADEKRSIRQSYGVAQLPEGISAITNSGLVQEGIEVFFDNGIKVTIATDLSFFG